MRRWLVLLGCFIGMGVSISATLAFPFGLYLEAMTREFGWSRTQFAATLSFVSLGNIAMLPVAGYAVDRIGPTRSILIGLLAGCLSCAAIALVRSYPAFIVVSCVASMSGSLALYPAYFAIVRGWFDRNLGLALAVASAGVAVGVAGFARLITVMIDAHGWRSAFVASALVALVLGLLGLWLLIRENRGALPDAERLRNQEEGPLAGSSLGEALRTGDFWLFSIAFLLVVFAGSGPQVHLPALLSDKGVSSGTIASVIAALSVGSIAGRIATGALLDRVSFRVVATIFFLGQALGIVILARDPSLAILAAVLMGGALGSEIDIMGFVMARRFGRVAYAKILGVALAVAQSALLVSPVGTGIIYDHYHSYDLVLWTYPVLPVVAVILILFARTSRPVPAPADAARRPQP
ncbi:MFS transporter [uncultured Sphingomonas sp.]|uniref:MFS transporter n=1 Tax=uncultured Sphingomonas sp. TaxID=158754 RepID=UPI0035CC6871